MTRVDWEKLRTLSPAELNEEDKDELYDVITSFDINTDISVSNSKLLFCIAQDILKYKGEQVETLILEIDDLASRQGREDAQRHRSLLEQIDDLKAQLSIKNNGIRSFKGSDNDDLRQQLVKLELQNDQLLSELKEREREVLVEKREVEKLSGQLVHLEREKSELRRELTALHEEANERSAIISRQESPDLSLEKQQEMVNSIRQKNKHITQLLSDVEAVEKENSLLREKVTALQDELSEATKHLTQLAGENSGLKCSRQEQEESLNTIVEQNAALRNQVNELVQQKLLRDTQLDDFTEALDNRIEEWKRVLEKKDAEIEELKARLTDLSAQGPNVQIDTERNHVALLTQTLHKREDQIEQLQNQLEQATKELNGSAGLIEQLKAKRSRSNSTTVDETQVAHTLKGQLQKHEEAIKLLESKLKDAEEDAHLKAKEASDIIVKLREYETGEYGLAEAVSEIKELRQQCRIREKHIEELVQAANKLEAGAGLLEEQNMALREKLNLPPEEPVCVDGILAQRKKEQTLMKVLQQQTERLEEEKLQLKLENRKLVQNLNDLTHQVEELKSTKLRDKYHSLSEHVESNSLVPVIEKETNEETSTEDMHQNSCAVVVKETIRDVAIHQIENSEINLSFYEQKIIVLQEKLESFINENEALRKGMHEILDSVRNQDGSSNVHLESPCLERLLEALDSRHVSGWYHPAMRLQAQLHTLEGSNSVLREHLKATRLEENKAREELQKTELKVQSLEQRLASLQDGKLPIKNVQEEINLPPNVPLSCAEVIGKLNAHLLQILNENNKMEEENKVLEKKFEDVSKRFTIVRHQMGLLYKQYVTDKTEWKTHQDGLISENKKLTDTSSELEVQLRECKSHLDALHKSPEEQQQLLSASAERMVEMQTSNAATLRKCKTLQDMECTLRRENEILKEDINDMECSVTKTIGSLQRQKEMAYYQISALQSKLEESVPLATLEGAQRKIVELTAKYRDIIQKEHDLGYENLQLSRLEKEKEILQSDKLELNKKLQDTTAKLHSLEALVVLNENSVSQDIYDNQISSLTKKLAGIELKELNEKQRADNAENLLEVVKGQCNQLEERVNAIEAQNLTLQQTIQRFQKEEHDLQERLLNSVSEEEWRVTENKLRLMESEKNKLQLEKKKLQEVGDIAQEQVRSLELWKLSQDYQLQSLRQQILDMQSADDARASVARLSHELLTAKLNEAACIKKVQQLRNELTKIQAYSFRQECRLDEKEREMVQYRNKLNARFRSLNSVVHSLRQQFTGAIPLLSQEHFSNTMQELRKERRLATNKLWESRKVIHETSVSKEELELELESLKELKLMINNAKQESSSGQKQIVELHSRNTELRIKELKLSRQVEFLEAHCQQADKHLQSQEEHIANLEDENLKVIQGWEQAQSNWEQNQEELLKQISEHETHQKVLEVSNSLVSSGESEQEKDTSNENIADQHLTEQLKQALALVSSQTQSLLKCEAELAQLKTKVTNLNQELEEKECSLATKGCCIDELRAQMTAMQKVVTSASNIPLVVQEVHEKETESSEKLALKATVDSLQSILNQKEETISRYQQLLKETRDEHSRAAVRFQEEILGLQTALSVQQQTYNRLKNRSRHPANDLKHMPAIMDKYLHQLKERDDEITKLHATIGNMGNQTQSVRQEVDRWRVLAEERLKNMGDLHHRLDEQHQLELQTLRDEAQRYRLELDAARQDLSVLQEQLKQHMDSASRSPSAVLQGCVSMLRAQLQEKETQKEILSRTVIELQKELQQLAESAAREAVRRPQLTVMELAAVAASQGEERDPRSPRRIRQTAAQEKKLASELKAAKLQIQKLQEQLFQKSQQSVRDKSSESRSLARETQLQKKIKCLEEEIEELKKKQEKDDEARRIKTTEEVSKWEERKKIQQNVEKLKQKLQEKCCEVEKLQKSCNGLRDLVSRLEREKIILDNKIKALKGPASAESRIQVLELEKHKLQAEVNALKTRLEMYHYHSGSVGSTVLHNRLESQQRRIAALELSKKGDNVKALEFEKLQSSNVSLLKAKTRLEKETLHLQCELESVMSYLPQIKEQIENLDTTVALLKSEQEQVRSSHITGGGDAGSQIDLRKSTFEIQKSVTALQDLLVKMGSLDRPVRDRKDFELQETSLQFELRLLKEENLELQDRYTQALQDLSDLQVQLHASKAKRNEAETCCKAAMQKATALENELKRIKSIEDADPDTVKDVELNHLKSQLVHKSQLLERVKVLLKQAAAKEKALHEQVSTLQSLVPPGALEDIDPVDIADIFNDVEVL